MKRKVNTGRIRHDESWEKRWKGGVKGWKRNRKHKERKGRMKGKKRSERRGMLTLTFTKLPKYLLASSWQA